MTELMGDSVHRSGEAAIVARGNDQPVATDQAPAARLPVILRAVRRRDELVDEEDVQGLRVLALAMASRVDQQVRGVEQGVAGRVGAEGRGGSVPACAEDVVYAAAE